MATIQLCERHAVEDERARYPAQWAYFVWAPRTKALPHAVPNGWGVLLTEPEADLAEIIGEAPVYALSEFEFDWPTLLDILLECDPNQPWLHAIILAKREQAARRRREHWRTLYGDDRPVFERFMRRLQADFGRT